MLRLPLSFSFVSVSLTKDTIYDVTLFFMLVGVVTFTLLTRISFLTLIRLYVVRMETVGSPKFPWIPCVHLHLFLDSGRTSKPHLYRFICIAPILMRMKAPARYLIFRSSIILLLYSLCTLRACVSTDYATLGFGCWLGFADQDWLPEGILRKISKNFIYPSFMGLSWRNINYQSIINSLGPLNSHRF